MLARDLRQVVPWVTGIDRDAGSIELARRLDEDIEFIVGLARNRYPADLPFAIAGAAGHRIHRLSKPCWEDAAPRLWPPPDTFTQTRRLAQRLLPGVRYRRLLLFRYSLLWTKPAHAT
jgi:hypothetical protein